MLTGKTCFHAVIELILPHRLMCLANLVLRLFCTLIPSVINVENEFVWLINAKHNFRANGPDHFKSTLTGHASVMLN